MLRSFVTHEKETSNARFVHGHRENADPHPSDTFKVTLRGETTIQALDARRKPLNRQFQSAGRRRDRYIKLHWGNTEDACLLKAG
jgi:hypothetical protein